MRGFTDLELVRFSKLMSKWLWDGKMFVIPVADHRDMPGGEGLGLALEFPAGDEVIDNDGLGFNWRDIFEMTKQQGLLGELLDESEREKILNGHSWIKVPRYVDDESLPMEERHRRLMEHHRQETEFLINKVRELAQLI